MGKAANQSASRSIDVLDIFLLKERVLGLGIRALNKNLFKNKSLSNPLFVINVTYKFSSSIQKWNRKKLLTSFLRNSQKHVFFFLIFWLLADSTIYENASNQKKKKIQHAILDISDKLRVPKRLFKILESNYLLRRVPFRSGSCLHVLYIVLIDVHKLSIRNTSNAVLVLLWSYEVKFYHVI